MSFNKTKPHQYSVFPKTKTLYGRALIMSLLYFLMAFVYNLMRPLKMAVVVSASEAGAEIIPFLKVWGMVPVAFLMSWAVLRLMDRWNRSVAFIGALLFFSFFFAVFSLFLYPMTDYIKLTNFSLLIAGYLPTGARGFVAMIEYWHFSFFYLLSELWSPIMMTVIFWGVANEDSSLEEATKFYPIYNFAGNCSGIVSGYLGVMVAQNASLNTGIFFSTLQQVLPIGLKSSVVITALIGVMSCAVIGLLYYMLPTDHNQKQFVAKNDKPQTTKDSHMGIMHGFARVSHSPYLLHLTMIVLGYNLVFNVTDVIWTDQLKQNYGQDQDGFFVFLNQVTIMKGVMASVLGLIISSWLIRKHGWFAAAVFTPIVMFISCLIFFPIIYFKDADFAIAYSQEMFSMTMTSLAISVGAIQNSAARALKYSIYDTTKEMAFIPLSESDQREAKAVIDGIGSRLGKSGGSLFLQAVLLIFGSFQGAFYSVLFLCLFFSIAWIYSVKQLSKLLK